MDAHLELEMSLTEPAADRNDDHATLPARDIDGLLDRRSAIRLTVANGAEVRDIKRAWCIGPGSHFRGRSLGRNAQADTQRRKQAQQDSFFHRRRCVGLIGAEFYFRPTDSSGNTN